MRNGCALVVVVFMVRDLGVISNSKLRVRKQLYFGTFFETSVLALEFAWRTTQMDADRTSGWQVAVMIRLHIMSKNVAYMCFPECPALQKVINMRQLKLGCYSRHGAFLSFPFIVRFRTILT